MPSHADAPTSAVDARGRIIPRTPEERRRRAEDAIRALDALDDIGSEEEQRRTFVQLYQGLNADPLSARRRFRG